MQQSQSPAPTETEANANEKGAIDDTEQTTPRRVFDEDVINVLQFALKGLGKCEFQSARLTIPVQTKSTAFLPQTLNCDRSTWMPGTPKVVQTWRRELKRFCAVFE